MRRPRNWIPPRPKLAPPCRAPKSFFNSLMCKKRFLRTFTCSPSYFYPPRLSSWVAFCDRVFWPRICAADNSIPLLVASPSVPFSVSNLCNECPLLPYELVCARFGVETVVPKLCPSWIVISGVGCIELPIKAKWRLWSIFCLRI